MEIIRENMSCISKHKFTEEMFVKYSSEQLLFMEEALKDVINNFSISTIDCITYLRKHYNGDLLTAMNKITDEEAEQIRFNCIYQSKVLKELLLKKEINGYYVSYKSMNFTTPKSDALFKESHTSIFVPTIIKEKKCLIILEPGLKIDKPIYLCEDGYANTYDDLNIEIGKTDNKDYPFYLLLDGINKYSYNPKPHKVYQEFDVDYYTINPIKLLIPYIYKYISGYRATNFSLDITKRMSLTIMPVKQKIEIYIDKFKEKLQYSYDEITEDLLLEKLPEICRNLNLNLEETIDNVLFMKKVRKEFIEMMDQDAVKVYLRK